MNTRFRCTSSLKIHLSWNVVQYTTRKHSGKCSTEMIIVYIYIYILYKCVFNSVSSLQFDHYRWNPQVFKISRRYRVKSKKTLTIYIYIRFWNKTRPDGEILRFLYYMKKGAATGTVVSCILKLRRFHSLIFFWIQDPCFKSAPPVEFTRNFNWTEDLLLIICCCGRPYLERKPTIYLLWQQPTEDPDLLL
jgi:hypothetical protein